MKAVVLATGADLVAVPAVDVRQVVPMPALTRLPLTARSVLGLTNLRGELVPVFDIAALEGFRSGEPTHLVVALTPDGPAGVVSTMAPRLVELDERLGDSTLPAGRGTYAVPSLDDAAAAVLLDVTELLTRLRTPAGADGS